MALYSVSYIRRDVTIDRYSIVIDADSPEAAVNRVREHFMDYEDVLTDDELETEEHDKCLEFDGGEVIDVHGAILLMD